MVEIFSRSNTTCNLASFFDFFGSLWSLWAVVNVAFTVWPVTSTKCLHVRQRWRWSIAGDSLLEFSPKKNWRDSCSGYTLPLALDTLSFNYNLGWSHQVLLGPIPRCVTVLFSYICPCSVAPCSSSVDSLFMTICFYYHLSNIFHSGRSYSVNFHKASCLLMFAFSRTLQLAMWLRFLEEGGISQISEGSIWFCRWPFNAHQLVCFLSNMISCALKLTNILILENEHVQSYRIQGLRCTRMFFLWPAS